MKKSIQLHNGWRVMLGLAVLTAVLLTGLMSDAFGMVSLAASAGKVTATSANVRKEPSTKSESVTGVVQDNTLSIKGQTTGSDGYTWYQVDIDGVIGYIRSDLVEITDGSTPPTVVPSTTTTTTPDDTSTPAAGTQTVEVTALEPVGASVSGGSPVRVRQDASTTSRIVTTAQSGLAMTVTGKAVGTDGNEWYRVEYIANGSTVTGFVRADYVTVDGELVPAGTGAGAGETPDENSPAVEPTDPKPVEATKEWDTYYEGGKWHLINNTNGQTYDPQGMIDTVDANTQTLSDALSKTKTQKIIIVILVILVIGLIIAVTYLIFKVKDMSDAAYFSAVERETIRRRTADRPAGSGQKVMHTVSAGNGQRPAGQKPGSAGGGQRPAGQRPNGGGAGNGGNAQRPAGQKPNGSGAGQKPNGGGAGNGGNAQRPAGQKPSGSGAANNAGNGGNAQRPAGQKPAADQLKKEEKPGPGQPAQKPAEKASEKPEQPAKKNPNWKSKNFAADDEEFEFKFLDWDEKEEQ